MALASVSSRLPLSADLRLRSKINNSSFPMNQLLLSLSLFLSSLLLGIYAVILRFLRAIGFIQIIPSSALILPPAAPGSLGDEAMVVASTNYLNQQGITQVSLVAFNSRHQYPVAVLEAIEMRDYFLYKSWYKFIFKVIFFGYKMSRYERFYCLGADLMDGHYSDYATFKRVKLVEFAEKIGIESTILGFSFNATPTVLAQQVFQKLSSRVRLCTRDPISLERLKNVLDRPIQLVADAAFLLSSDDDSEKVLQVSHWIKEQRENSRIVVGINLNSLLLDRIENKNSELLIQAYVRNFVKLFSRCDNLSYLIIPHDLRRIKGKLNDKALATKMLQGFPAEIQPYCLKIPFPCRAAEIKAMVGQLDLVLSSRMHLAIACLGKAVP
ncbi:MAG: polysaccharide pyruvyl transferase family protein, partial [Cyanobacteriota bacterium]|nr:polysaccharide pyruvyl transferase family protein [Cyanobacteriota bacterium]